MAERHYSREEMQAILARAIERQAAGTSHDDLSHAQLLETAREVGLSPAEIEAAVAAVDRLQARDRVIGQLQLHRRQQLRGHAVVYLAVNLGLWGIDFATASMGVNHRPGWHWIVAAGWGIALQLHAWRTFRANPETLKRDAERWQQRQQRKLQKQQMQHAIEGAVTDVVTTGADALSRLLDPQRQRERDQRRRDRDRRP